MTLRPWSALLALSLVSACKVKDADDGDSDTDVAVETDDDTDVVVDTEVEDTDDSAVDTEIGDADGDGLDDEQDPTPNGSDANVLNGTATGGHAEVVLITGTDSDGTADSADIPYNHDLTVFCDDEWYPNGSLCDAGPGANTATSSTRPDDDGYAAGATWNDDGGATGILVVDACADDGCATIDFLRIVAFQMFSDGKTTALRVAVHGETGATPPAWDDEGWTVVGPGWITVPEGTYEDDTDEWQSSTDPADVDFSPAVETRYVRVEAKNDGTHGDDGYIELRSLKLFGAPAVE